MASLQANHVDTSYAFKDSPINHNHQCEWQGADDHTWLASAKREVHQVKQECHTAESAEGGTLLVVHGSGIQLSAKMHVMSVFRFTSNALTGAQGGVTHTWWW
jgi:hypothetical protein